MLRVFQCKRYVAIWFHFDLAAYVGAREIYCKVYDQENDELGGSAFVWSSPGVRSDVPVSWYRCECSGSDCCGYAEAFHPASQGELGSTGGQDSPPGSLS